VVENERMHCLVAVVEGPEANILAPGSYSEAAVVYKLAYESRSRNACEHQKLGPSEIPGLERVRFRTQIYAYTRTSSTLPSSNTSMSSSPRLPHDKMRIPHAESHLSDRL
jgi:hypothetical protein